MMLKATNTSNMRQAVLFSSNHISKDHICPVNGPHFLFDDADEAAHIFSHAKRAKDFSFVPVLN